MSNTPLQYAARDFRQDALIIQVDLFSGLGELPRNLGQVQERVKDIQFQSKSHFSIEQMRKIEDLRSALADVIGRLPKAMRADPQVRKLEAISQRGPVSLVHLVNRCETKSYDFKDYEFSRATVDELWRAGHNDVQMVLQHPEVCTITELGNGLRIFDLALPGDKGVAS
jgi:NTE family protein